MCDLQNAIFNNLIGIAVNAKDRHSRYIWCNETLVKDAGLDSPNQMVGKTDSDFCWAEQAEIYFRGDRIVLTGGTYMNQVEPQTRKNGLTRVLVSKTQLLNNSDKCIGTICTHVTLSKHFLREKNLNFSRKDKRICMGKYYNNEYLTVREADVLKGILLGYPAKLIGKILRISNRTVENHIANIKLKMQATTKADIVINAMNSGLTYYIFDLSTAFE